MRSTESPAGPRPVEHEVPTDRQDRRRDEYAHLAPVQREFAGLSGEDPRRSVLRDQLVREHFPIVEHIALRFRDRGEPLADLQQAGAIGLVNAVDRFDPNHGGDFIAFAVPTITGEIRRHFRDRTWSLHVPRRMRDLHVRMGRAQEELAARLHRAPRVSELAAHLGLPTDEVIDGLAAQQAYSTHPIDTPSGDDGEAASGEWSARLAEIDSDFGAVEARETLRPLIVELPEREQLIVVLRFHGNMTQTQIADRVGLSQMHVSRILARTLATLRQRIEV